MMAPPTVIVRATYPGAAAQTVADTVATVLEQEINGVEDMLYLSSISTNDGQTKVTVTFKLGPIWTRRKCSFRTASVSRVPAPSRGCATAWRHD